MSYEKVADVFMRYDKDESGQIEFGEFLLMFQVWGASPRSRFCPGLHVVQRRSYHDRSCRSAVGQGGWAELEAAGVATVQRVPSAPW
jgi:hypothetical protein